jgi:hypothetical protein
MVILTAQPSLSDLYGLINKVPRYPLSIQRLLKLAVEVDAPREVVSFYKVFADDQVFDDEEDLAGRTEQVKIMRQEEADMPKEDIIASQED